MARWRPLLEPFYYNPDGPETLLEKYGLPYPPPAPTADESGNNFGR